jgi:thiol:disulfide interchange protein DsbA
MKKLFALFLLVCAPLSFNFALAAPQIGTDFEQTQQVIPSDNPNKIQVTELFWYGCSHCYAMDPILNAWVKNLPKDVEFKRIPGVPNASWVPMAKAFYAMEALGLSAKLHTSLFDAIHKQKSVNPADEKAAIDWMTKASGLDRAKVNDAFNSFSMNTQVKRAAQIFAASGATGVPSLLVDGKYITSSTMAGGNTQALQVADFIIEGLRAKRVKK